MVWLFARLRGRLVVSQMAHSRLTNYLFVCPLPALGNFRKRLSDEQINAYIQIDTITGSPPILAKM